MDLLPEEFSKRMAAFMGDEFQSFAYSCISGDRKNALRITELKTTAKEFYEQAPFKMEPVQWVRNGFFYDYKDEVTTHPFFRAGLYYITEASAMTPADRLPVEPGDRVLDLCAAPGGKAFALAGKLKGTGVLVANEVNASRAKALLYNLEMLGAANILITNEQPHKMAETFGGFFDKILVDAPCSGEGMFRRNAEAAKQWSEEKVRTLAGLQKSILGSAVRMLKPGGLLMYSTCTFSPEENEQNVSWLLNEYKEMEITKIEPFEGFDHGRPEWANGDGRVAEAVRIWPHRMDGEGQFLALFRKNSVSEPETVQLPATLPRRTAAKKETSGPRKMTADEKKDFEEFARHMDLDRNGKRIEVRRESVFLVPDEMPDAGGVRIVRRGLYLGELRKNRFEPSQSLAFALSAKTFDNVYELEGDPDSAGRYLRGETISDKSGEESVKNGWILITYGGFSLGFGKKNGSLIKNKLLYSRRT